MSDQFGALPEDDDISAWIRHRPEVWPDPVAAATDAEEQWAEVMVHRVLAAERRPRRRRHRRAVAGGVAVLVVAGGAAGAAALLRGGQPSVPEAGPACRAEARLDAEAVVLPTGTDPVSGCLRVWEGGRFGRYMGPEGIPPLLACVGPGGAIEVFPGLPTVCADLGLVPADPTLTPENEAVVRLQGSLIETINAAGCVTVEDATRIAQQSLESLGLASWTVAVEPGTQDGCAKAAVDSETRRILVSHV